LKENKYQYGGWMQKSAEFGDTLKKAEQGDAIEMEISMKEMWQEICFILTECKKSAISETICEQKILRVLEKLGWSQFKKEIRIRPKIYIDRQKFIEPDIAVICGSNNEAEIVFGIEHSLETTSNNYHQLKSYMRQLKCEIGVLIGNEIHIYYDGDLISGGDPVLIMKIPLNADSSNGIAFVRFFEKTNYFQKVYLGVLKEWVNAYEKKIRVQELKKTLLSENTKKKIIRYLKNDLSFFGEEILSEIMMNMKIDISFTHYENLNKNIASKKNVFETEVFKISEGNLISKKFDNEAAQQPYSNTPNTYLLTWNPKLWIWKELPYLVEKKKMGSDVILRWSCGNRRDIEVGDRVFIIRLGRPPKGIFANGVVICGPFEDSHWDFERKKYGVKATYLEIKIEILINPEENAIIPIDYLKTNFKDMLWTPQSPGTFINKKTAFELENQLKKIEFNRIPCWSRDK
jgi:hypothetical protein